MVASLLADGGGFTPAEGLSPWWAPSSGDMGHGVTRRRSSSASMLQIPLHRSSRYPLALEMSQGNHPPRVTCPIKQEGRVPPEPEPRSQVAVPAQQGPLAGQLLAKQDVLPGSQRCRQQLSIPFYHCQADGEQVHLLLFPGAAAVCSSAGEGWSLPSLGRGIRASIFPRGC